MDDGGEREEKAISLLYLSRGERDQQATTKNKKQQRITI